MRICISKMAYKKRRFVQFSVQIGENNRFSPAPVGLATNSGSAPGENIQQFP